MSPDKQLEQQWHNTGNLQECNVKPAAFGGSKKPRVTAGSAPTLAKSYSSIFLKFKSRGSERCTKASVSSSSKFRLPVHMAHNGSLKRSWLSANDRLVADALTLVSLP
jgi:hypothetical protein